MKLAVTVLFVQKSGTGRRGCCDFRRKCQDVVLKLNRHIALRNTG